MKRGTRNNNPGNIKYTSLNWKGKVPKSANTDQRNSQGNPTFEQFQEMQFGIRALYRLLVTYANKYGIRSVDQIIDRYAPPGENSESARANYKQFVKDTASTDMMNTRADLYAIGKGIMIFETSKSDWDTYIVPYTETARRITDLSDFKELQPIITVIDTPAEEKKNTAGLGKILGLGLLLSFFSKK